MRYVVAEPCIDCKDRTCVEVCPVDCIYEGPRMLYIHPDECVGCGACEWACPVEAIYHEVDLPKKWAQYADVNAEFTRALGTPGGASTTGPLGDDHPLVAGRAAPRTATVR
jgi:NAD-dependent dihydropyrimidine dehydrogenase PreA subunit